MHRKVRGSPMASLFVLALLGCGDDDSQRSSTDHVHEEDAAAPVPPDQPSDAAALEDDAGRDSQPSMPASDAGSADVGARPDHADAGSPHTDELLERLLVADGLAPVARIVDAASRETLASFALTSTARVYRGALGRYGYAVQGTANRVQIFDSGIVSADHGDHLDHERHAPGLLPLQLEAQRPVHFVGHGTHVAAFFDDDGIALVLDEASLGAEQPSLLTLDTGLPHHGVAVAFGAQFLASVPELIPPAERASPVGIAVYDEAGEPTAATFGPCPGLHGEAALDDVAAFGCSDGVLLVERTGGVHARKIPNPASDQTPAPRVGTLAAHHAVPHMIGNFGADQLSIIDLANGTITPVQVPAPYMQFGIDAHGEHVLLLAKSGTLHILDVRDLSQRAELPVTTAPSDDSGHGAFYPQFAVGAHHLYVTDPQRGRVVVVDVESAAIDHEIAVAGSPTKIAVLGPASVH